MFSHARHVIFQTVRHDNLRFITNRQLSILSVINPDTCWYVCATPECIFDNRKKWKYSYIQNVQLNGNSHTHDLTPPSLQILISGGIFLIYGTCQKNKAMSSSIVMLIVFLISLILSTINIKKLSTPMVNIYKGRNTVDHFRWRD